MSKVFRQIATFIKEAWATLMEVESEFQQIETNARLIQSMPMEETVVIVMMDISIGEMTGTLRDIVRNPALTVAAQHHARQFANANLVDAMPAVLNQIEASIFLRKSA